MVRHAGVTAALPRRNMVLVAIDAFHRVPPTNPRPIFVARVLVGTCLVSLAGSVPSLGAAVVAGERSRSDPPGHVRPRHRRATRDDPSRRTARCGGLVAPHRVRRHRGRVVPDDTRTTAQQPYWLVLLPLAAHVLAAPGPEDSKAVRTPAPAAATLLAVGLGILDVVAHQVGLTFDEPNDLIPAWALGPRLRDVRGGRVRTARHPHGVGTRGSGRAAPPPRPALGVRLVPEDSRRWGMDLARAVRRHAREEGLDPRDVPELRRDGDVRDR